MCGIAGAFDLTGQREFPQHRLLAMTGALAHRGPDDEQVHLEPGLALGVRRLSVIDVAGGRQPLCNEDGQIWVAYEGELFNYPELSPQLLERGHTLKTSCDTEAWVHLYEDYGEDVFLHARGQFGVSVWDRKTRTLLLGRDRVGISPLFYTKADGWLLWSSEIKGLLASRLIDAAPDPLGLDYFFNFFAVSNTRTCFKNVQSILPGHFLKVHGGEIQQRRYWDFDFPDAGDAPNRFGTSSETAERCEHLLRGAIRRRLTGEVPICCYISGGLDSTMIMGIGSQEKGSPLPAFTIGLDESGPRDERAQARESASLIGSPLTTVTMRERDIADTYPELIRAAESPVMDTSAACMIRLAQSARQQGYTVTLTGEGSDESFAGYIWFKADQLVRLSGRPFNQVLRSLLLSRMGGATHRPPWRALSGARVAQQFTWELMGQSREVLYSPKMWKAVDGYAAYDDIPVASDRFSNWHPLNQSLYAANKVLLPGMLLAAKGDRALRNGHTEGRFPFLDEEMIHFACELPPSYKLRRWTDKWLLRQVAKRALPSKIAGRPKTMFRANFSWSFLGPDRPAWVDQLLSPESLAEAGYFDPAGVARARELQFRLSRRSLRRFALDMGLVGVISTQLWHHTFLGGGLADVPVWEPPSRSKVSRDAGPVELETSAAASHTE